jgi:hypothetical protein
MKRLPVAALFGCLLRGGAQAQTLRWAARTNVDVVHRPDNWLEFGWATVQTGAR